LAVAEHARASVYERLDEMCHLGSLLSVADLARQARYVPRDPLAGVSPSVLELRVVEDDVPEGLRASLAQAVIEHLEDDLDDCHVFQLGAVG
jgi:hypothetical protein